MKLAPPENSNYAVSIVRVPDKLLDLPGLDKLKGFPVFGLQALVSAEEFQPGELVAVFPTEVQLSHEFCAANGLYRHAELNDDKTVTGYLEDNRRVRAIKFRGHRSDALIVPLSAFAYTDVRFTDLQVGDTFDKLNTYPICTKYVIRTNGTGKGNKAATKRPSRVDTRVFPEHIETENYWKNAHLISPDTWVYVSQKVHGSSARIGRVPVRRKLRLHERVVKRLGVKVVEHEHDVVFGSRKVIKDARNPNQAHWYDTDIWTASTKHYADVIPEGWVIYGELIGWTGPGGAAIQKHYTYKIPEGTNRFLVYRVTYVNSQGVQVDLSWTQLRAWTRSVGLDTVRVLWEGWYKDFEVEDFLDMRFTSAYPQSGALPLEDTTKEDKKLVDEGVVVRADNGIRPTLLKAKSPAYLTQETEWLDAGEADLETVGSEEDGTLGA